MVNEGGPSPTLFTLTGFLPGPSFEFLSSDAVLARDGKRPASPNASWGAVVVCVCVVIPLYVGVTIGVLLPLTVAAAAYRKAVGAGSPSPPRRANPAAQTGSAITTNPRGARKWDLVVFGATGYTGGLAVEHLAKTYGKSQSKLRWAMAGRSATKLTQRRAEICSMRSAT